MNQSKYINKESTKEKSFMVLDDLGETLGQMHSEKALELANSKYLDLVLVSKGEGKPVAKIVDYNKFMYESKKKTICLKVLMV